MQKQIATNTLYLYVRQLILLVVSLYTVRIVLEVLGVENYGVYNVIAGFVSIFNIVCTNFNVTTQRYISYSLGSKEVSKISNCFSNSFILHIILGIIVVLLLETIGILGFDSLNIPKDTDRAANIVFQLSVFTMFLSITQVPYNALVVANERMNVFAYISILEALLKLALVFVLKHIKFDVLIVYAIMMAFMQFAVMMTYRVYCLKKLREQCKIRFKSVNKKTQSEMLKFSGWSLLTSSAWILKAQGINMILNIFFGAAINAARGVTNQIVSIVTSFMLNFQMAANPKINQYHATGNLKEMQTLVYQSIKISFYLLLILFVPIWIEIDSILSLWLVDIPPYTTVFIRILIIELLIDSSTGPLATAVRASGRVRKYSIVDFSILIWNIPICWVMFKLGYGPQIAYVVALIITTIAVIARHIIVIQQLEFSWKLYWKDVLSHEIILFIIGSIIALVLTPSLADVSLIVKIILSLCILALLIIFCYFLGLSNSERASINKIIVSKLKIQ